MTEIARPTHEDPMVTSLSEGIGGPVGYHAVPHRWWTPVRVVLAVACLVLVAGMVSKTPCVRTGWGDTVVRYAAMCYSDVPYLYGGRGFAERVVPFSDTADRYPALEYPVLTGWFAYGNALVTQVLSGWPDLTARAEAQPGDLWSVPGVHDEAQLYFVVTAVALALLGLLTAYLLARANRGRPWDAMFFAASPALAMAGLVNWDLLAAALVAGALLAWSRGRPVLTGVLVGLGTAAKLYPLFLLGALLVVCVRRRRLGWFAQATFAAAATWLAVNLPPILLSFDQWSGFWRFNADRGADLGSLWLVAQQHGYDVPASLINNVSWVFFGGWCVAVLVLGVAARRTPRMAQLAFLVVAGFLLVNKVYSPQYVLWLLPLAVLARPRLRDLLVWTSGEVLYFAAVWWYLGEHTASAASGQPDLLYQLAIVLRVLAQLYLVAVVVRDVLVPWRDPVRADGLTDDPLDPVPEPVR